MQKIIIIGSPGAGKSTFARRLAGKTNLPLYHLDMIWHKPDKTTLEKSEFDAILKDILGRDEWIVDGNYQRTLEMRMDACDTVFLLDFPVDVCLSGAQARVGTKRLDMPWVETSLDTEFEQLIRDFSNTKLPKIYEILERCQDTKQIKIFRSREETEDYLSTLE